MANTPPVTPNASAPAAQPDPPPNPQQGAVLQFLTQQFSKISELVGVLTTILVAVSVIVVMVLIIQGISSDRWGVLEHVKDLAYARGLITFTITVATIAIAVLLVTTAVFGVISTDDQFRRAREIFGVLAGVLGTIVGFYFGSADKGPVKALALAEVRLLDSPEGAASRIKQIATMASGGIPPYHYEIRLDSKTTLSGDSKDGLILERMDDPGSAKVTLSVRDSINQTTEGTASKATPSPSPSPSGSPSPSASPSPSPSPKQR